MKAINKNHDDFILKLRQHSAIKKLKKYILWQRRRRSFGNSPAAESADGFLEGPISVNLDITQFCNFSCGHCVDSGILNVGSEYSVDEAKGIMDVLVSRGLKSVILIGGGEPLCHSEFESIVRYIKSLGLQLGIATNGSYLPKLINIADCLKERDWMRFSIDAGSDKTYQLIHKPKNRISLLDVASGVKHIKKINSKVSVGFSYIIFWQGCKIGERLLAENIDEMAEAVELAVQNQFDYITFKPCLIKSDFTADRETLLFRAPKEYIKSLRERIGQGLAEAKKTAQNSIKVNESINLQAILKGDLDNLKIQPRNCHSQFFRQVISPIGIYHCPAYRGSPKAFIVPKDGYQSEHKFKETVIRNTKLMSEFDASRECKEIVCFYNRLNWWVEDLIKSNKDVDSIEAVEDENFFL